MNRTLIAAPVAIFMTALTLASATPAFAQGDVCAAPAALRTAAASAQPDAAKKALKSVAMGELLCGEGNKRDAAAKFKAAAKALGVDYASLSTKVAAN